MYEKFQKTQLSGNIHMANIVCKSGKAGKAEIKKKCY